MTDSKVTGDVLSPVGLYSIDESVYGVRDFAGNLQDWTSSVFSQENQESNVHSRVVRGGAWDFFADLTRVCYRNYAMSDTPYSNIGFRLVRPFTKNPVKCD